MWKYKAAATHIELKRRSTVLRDFDEDLPLEVAPLTTLLSTIAVILVGQQNLQHLWASRSKAASSSIFMWDSFLKVQAESTLQLPDIASSFTPMLSRPFETGMASSAIRLFSCEIHVAKSEAIASARRSV